MIKSVRMAKIQEILYNVGSVRVDELSELLGVSQVTIRSDLNELEQMGLASRVHGGAVALETDNRFKPVFDVSKDVEEVVSRNVIIPLSAERQISLIARNVIREGSWIYLGCGSTCATIAGTISDLRINVLTNSILVATMLAKSPTVNVLMAGGYLSGNYRSYTSGDIFENTIKDIRVDYAFFGTSAISFEHGFAVKEPYEKSIYQAVKKVAKKTVIVAGAYKYAKDSYFTLADLCEPDMVIADHDVPMEYKRYFDENGISLVTSVEDGGLSEYEKGTGIN